MINKEWNIIIIPCITNVFQAGTAGEARLSARCPRCGVDQGAPVLYYKPSDYHLELARSRLIFSPTSHVILIAGKESSTWRSSSQSSRDISVSNASRSSQPSNG